MMKSKSNETFAEKQAKGAGWPEDVPVLTIKNFSCIRELTVEFRRVVVFIGEQASGKSVTCKLYYYFTQALLKVALSCLHDELGADDFRKRLIQEFAAIFPVAAWQEDTFSIVWKSGARQISISHRRGNKRIKLELFDYSDRYQRVLEKVQTYRETGDRQSEFEHRWRYDQFVAKALGEELPSVSVDYIPAGRSFFSTIQDVVFSLLSNNVGIDYFLKEFGQKLETIRRMGFMISDEEWRTGFFEDLCQQILHGKYHYDGKDQWIVTDKNHRIRLADASSGQQEALPLLMMLARLAALSRRRGGMNRILIEEPEAHLYPTAQQSIVETIGKILQKDASIGCIITTHSPFILCCLNNELKRQRGLQTSVSAYHLHDGIGDDIYDADLNLIDSERFDDISISIANA